MTRGRTSTSIRKRTTGGLSAFVQTAVQRTRDDLGVTVRLAQEVFLMGGGVAAHLRLRAAFGNQPRGDARRHLVHGARCHVVEAYAVELVEGRSSVDTHFHINERSKRSTAGARRYCSPEIGCRRDVESGASLSPAISA